MVHSEVELEDLLNNFWKDKEKKEHDLYAEFMEQWEKDWEKENPSYLFENENQRNIKKFYDHSAGWMGYQEGYIGIEYDPIHGYFIK